MNPERKRRAARSNAAPVRTRQQPSQEPTCHSKSKSSFAPTILPAVRRALAANRATHVGLFHETNIFFDRPDNSLRAKDTGLRIRLFRRDDAPAPAALLTVKGPREATGLRSREAFDLELSPADQAIPMLLALGFVQVLLFEKRRDSWEFRDCKVELDQLPPPLGTFVEIEGPSEGSVLAVQQVLGLGTLEQEDESYSKMVAGHVTRQQIADRSLRFDASH